MGIISFTRHLECGLHSGFPKCCIAWWLLVDQPINCMLDKKLKNTKFKKLSPYILYRAMANYRSAIENKDWLRIPCPLCLCNPKAQFGITIDCNQNEHYASEFLEILFNKTWYEDDPTLRYQ